MKIFRIAIPIPFENQVNTLNNECFDGPSRIDQQYSQQQVNNIEKQFPNAKPIGFGNRGIAYDLGDKILKITTDWSEIDAAIQLITKPLDTHVTVYEINENDNYIIIEKIKPLTNTQKSIFSNLIDIYNDYFPQYLRKNNTIDTIKQITIQNFIAIIKTLSKKDISKKWLLSKSNLNIMIPKFVAFINKLEAEKLDPMFLDIHENNVGMDKNNNIKILDLGMSL
jgi:hypothetical protein